MLTWIDIASPMNTAPRLSPPGAGTVCVRHPSGTSIVQPYRSVWLVQATGALSAGVPLDRSRKVATRKTPAAAITRKPTRSPPARRRRSRRRRVPARSRKLPGSPTFSDSRRSSALRSSIGVPQGDSEIRSGLLGEASHGGIGNAHHPSGICRSVAEQRGQDDRLATSGREGNERAGQLDSILHIREPVPPVSLADHTPGSPARTAVPALLAVHRRLVEVAYRILHRSDPIPSLPGRDERLL